MFLCVLSFMFNVHETFLYHPVIREKLGPERDQKGSNISTIKYKISYFNYFPKRVWNNCKIYLNWIKHFENHFTSKYCGYGKISQFYTPKFEYEKCYCLKPFSDCVLKLRIILPGWPKSVQISSDISKSFSLKMAELVLYGNSYSLELLLILSISLHL